MQIKGVELQGVPSMIPGAHICAVIGEAVDGWRCYVAIVQMPIDPSDNRRWQAAKDRAVEFTATQGSKLQPEQVRQYFVVDHTTMRWAA